MTSIYQLVKVIADFAIFLEFTDQELLNPDEAVAALERAAVELKLLSDEERKRICTILTELSSEYKDGKAEFVKSLPESLGLF
jgi:hypothetical protein